MKELKTFLFDRDIFFETKLNDILVEISFNINGYNISVNFSENRKMIILLIYNNDIIKTYYEDDIEEILRHIAIYSKTAIECQQQIAVDFI